MNPVRNYQNKNLSKKLNLVKNDFNISNGVKKNSFTLLEVIIAITILTMAVGGSFILIQQTLIASSLNQSKLVAYYLTQEGIEIVRNIRDSNWLHQRSNPSIPWDEGLADDLTIGQSQDFIADYRTQELNSFVDVPLNLDIERVFYNYSPGDPTPFKRKISITKVDLLDTSDQEDYALKVLVQVEWSERGRNHSVEATEYIYNWYGY